jgi:uncharacterized protein DUF3467
MVGKATMYSNMLNVRTTPAELVFEFASAFQDQSTARPIGFEPEIRIVMPIEVLETLVGALNQALKDRQTEPTPKSGDSTPGVPETRQAK